MRALIITNSITLRDAKSIDKYLNEISKYDVLSPEEELNLFRRIKSGDEVAFQKIINHNLRFVVSVAKQYQHLNFSLGDLINEGNIGLLKAARRFDETKGFKFISYAVWWIRQSIIQAIDEKARKIRLPQNLKTTISHILKASEKFHKEFEREPSIEELSALTDLTIAQIKRALDNNQNCRSLDAPVEADGDTSLGYFLQDHSVPDTDYEVAEKESTQIEVQEMLKALPPREATVLSLYFGIDKNNPLTLQDIGELMGLTRERVRQVKMRGLKKLRRQMKKYA